MTFSLFNGLFKNIVFDEPYYIHYTVKSISKDLIVMLQIFTSSVYFEKVIK